MDIGHEVNVISVLVNPKLGVLLRKTESGMWGFPGSEDLLPGEEWQTTQHRGLNRDLDSINFENISILHLESYPAGTVGPNSKFGVFVFGTTNFDSDDSQSICWIQNIEDLQGLEVLHERVLELVEKALKMREAL